MNDREFRAFLDLMMCSDPWPSDEPGHEILVGLIEREAKFRGYDSWYVAFHEYKLP